jgi:hypothetical protein
MVFIAETETGWPGADGPEPVHMVGIQEEMDQRQAGQEQMVQSQYSMVGIQEEMDQSQRQAGQEQMVYSQYSMVGIQEEMDQSQIQAGQEQMVYSQYSMVGIQEDRDQSQRQTWQEQKEQDQYSMLQIQEKGDQSQRQAGPDNRAQAKNSRVDIQEQKDQSQYNTVGIHEQKDQTPRQAVQEQRNQGKNSRVKKGPFTGTRNIAEQTTQYFHQGMDPGVVSAVSKENQEKTENNNIEDHSDAYNKQTNSEECKECGKKYETLRLLKRHIETMHNPSTCSICLRKFSNRRHIIGHMIQIQLEQIVTSAVHVESVDHQNSL